MRFGDVHICISQGKSKTYDNFLFFQVNKKNVKKWQNLLREFGCTHYFRTPFKFVKGILGHKPKKNRRHNEKKSSLNTIHFQVKCSKKKKKTIHLLQLRKTVNT